MVEPHSHSARFVEESYHFSLPGIDSLTAQSCPVRSLVSIATALSAVEQHFFSIGVLRSRECPVRMATGVQTESLENLFLFPTWAVISLISIASTPALRPSPLCAVLNRPGRQINHALPSSVEVNAWSNTCTPLIRVMFVKSRWYIFFLPFAILVTN
jgi:hypothetical protein